MKIKYPFKIPPVLVLILCVLAQPSSLIGGQSVLASNWIEVDFRSETFLTWLRVYYDEASISDVRVTDSIADSDGDGSSNYFEFLAKLNPIDSDLRFRIYFADEAKEQLRFGPSMDGVSYEIQYSSDLEAWTTIEANLYQPIGEEIQIDTSSIPSPSFYRAIVSN